MNHLHVYLSLATVFLLPEGQRWVAKKGGHVFLVGKLFCVFLVFSSLNLAAVGVITLNAQILTVALIIAFLVSSHHGFNQMKGLSLLYNQDAKGKLTLSEKVFMEKVEKIERFIFDSTFFCFGLYFTFDIALEAELTLLSEHIVQIQEITFFLYALGCFYCFRGTILA